MVQRHRYATRPSPSSPLHLGCLSPTTACCDFHFSLPIGLAEFQYVTRDFSKQGASNIFPFAHISFPLLVCMCTMFRRELTCKGFEVCFPSWNVYCGPQPLSPLTVCLLVSAPADTVSESDSSLAGPSPLLSHVVLQV